MIYNAPSIYKQGGGGGGYADGGELIDSDFIKVENNTTYEYTNNSRNQINFYFENESNLNSIIDVTNNYNSTVDVYILENGIYTPIGVIGSNTLTSGKKYEIVITGLTFEIKEITPPDVLSLYDFGLWGIKKIVQLGGLIWTAENIDYNDRTTANSIVNSVSNGWRIPKNDDVNNLLNAVSNNYSSLCSLNGWNGSPGSNTSKYNAEPLGYFVKSANQYFNVGNGAWILKEYIGGNGSFCLTPNSLVFDSVGYDDSVKISIRLCKDI